MYTPNLDRLVSTPEGKQALEDGLIEWESTEGAFPTNNQMEIMASHIIAASRPVTLSTVLFTMLLKVMLVAAGVLFVVGEFIRAFLR